MIQNSKDLLASMESVSKKTNVPILLVSFYTVEQ